ncbi:MAG: response regulator [Candidatus Parcubacteria bacterium]|nr:response regulator [Leptolyngbyaceae cyanobacterium LF-bin-113]
MTNLWSQLFQSEAFMPHGHCYLWQTNLVGLHVISDALIALAYYSIPITLLYLVRKRQDLPFEWVFLLFGAFIVSCGTTHLLDIWTLWYPTYWLSGIVKAFTALISVITATQLFPLMPQVLALPSPAQLERANVALQSQVTERLRVEAELKVYQTQLEHLVTERTNELMQTNATLQAEISERKRIEQERTKLLVREQAARSEAEQANRIKDEFLAVLSHELRTPMNPILGWSKLLLSNRLNPAKSREAVETIERNAKLQMQLIDDLLDISRILSGKLSLDASPVDLNSSLSAALETLRLATEAKSLQIQTTLSSMPIWVMGDDTRLQQVIWNLLSNAIKFTPIAGQIEIHLTQTEAHAQIQIKDTGKGIHPDFLPYVFEHFRQEDGAITRKFGGLGLGLAIVRRIVELHGGTVRAESLGDSQGATFTVQIPRAVPLDEHSSLSDSSKPPTDLNGVQVLVVDDDEDSRNFIAFVLQQSGAIVTMAPSGIEALDAMTQSKPDVVVSDIEMPEMDGYQLVDKIRQLTSLQGKEVPAIALTAHAGESNQQQALKAGFQQHFSKPADSNELIRAIANLIK